MITRDKCERLMHEALALSTADETFLSLTALSSTSVPFSGGRLFGASRLHNASLTITVRTGGRYAMATTNRLDKAELARTIAETVARTAQAAETSVILPYPGATIVRESAMALPGALDALQAGWYADTARTLLDAAATEAQVATGSVTTSDSATCLASSGGLFLYQPATVAHAELRVFSTDGKATGFAEQRARDPRTLDAAALAARAVARCAEWRDPIALKPERITTVFEPAAVADILMHFIRQFDEDAVQEKRSFINRLDGSTRLGQELLAKTVHLTSDPYDPDIPSLPFTTDGQVVEPRSWVRAGVIEGIARSLAAARHLSREAVAPPSNLRMQGGESTLEALIAGVKRGVLVRRFASLQVEDPANCLLTGSTRDGFWLIEDGKLSRPAQNMMMRETPIYLLKFLTGMTPAEAVWPRGLAFPMHVPGIVVPEVSYSAVSGIV
jgi:predicted Zn-dependent protease